MKKYDLPLWLQIQTLCPKIGMDSIRLGLKTGVQKDELWSKLWSEFHEVDGIPQSTNYFVEYPSIPRAIRLTFHGGSCYRLRAVSFFF